MDDARDLAERLRPFLTDPAPPVPHDGHVPVVDLRDVPTADVPAPPTMDPPTLDPPAVDRPPVVAAPPAAPEADHAAPAPVPAARSASSAAEFTDTAMLRPAPAPLARGWRRVAQLASFGTYTPAPSAAQRAELELVRQIRTPVSGCRRIAVISRKGGVGKTTTTLMLGHALAEHRGDRVVALDGNPDAGSLGYRVERDTDATITDLLDAAAGIERYSDIRRFTSQSSSRLEVVASDDDPHISQAIGESEYRDVIALLERHYNLILLDTGTGILDSATQGILRMADQLVVVLSGSLDSSRAAGLTLDWLEQHGYATLVSGAVAVINQTRKRGLVEVIRVEDHFRARCRDVVCVPWDVRLEAGGVGELTDVAPATRQAYLELAAAVANGFAAQQP